MFKCLKRLTRLGRKVNKIKGPYYYKYYASAGHWSRLFMFNCINYKIISL